MSEHQLSAWNPKSGIQSLLQAPAGILDADLTPQGAPLWVCLERNGSLHWRGATRIERHFQGDSTCCAVSRTGDWLALGTQQAMLKVLETDGRVRSQHYLPHAIHQLHAGDAQHALTLHDGGVVCCCDARAGVLWSRQLAAPSGAARWAGDAGRLFVPAGRRGIEVVSTAGEHGAYDSQGNVRGLAVDAAGSRLLINDDARRLVLLGFDGKLYWQAAGGDWLDVWMHPRQPWFAALDKQGALYAWRLLSKEGSDEGIGRFLEFDIDD